jgi:hypothetical protein
MSANVDDWPTTLATFRDMFGDRLARHAGRFPGRNFMTDDVLGYVRAAGTVVEISTGVFLERRIIGVTFPPDADGNYGDDRSGCFDTLDDVRAYLMTFDGIRGATEVLP